jgi:hypothetical protein
MADLHWAIRALRRSYLADLSDLTRPFRMDEGPGRSAPKTAFQAWRNIPIGQDAPTVKTQIF